MKGIAFDDEVRAIVKKEEIFVRLCVFFFFFLSHTPVFSFLFSKRDIQLSTGTHDVRKKRS